MTWVAGVPGLSWLQALPALAVTVLLLWVPGSVIGHLAGARGRVLLSVAPVLTAGVLGVVAAGESLVPRLRTTWTGWWLLAAFAASCLLVLVARYLVGWKAVPHHVDRARPHRLDWLPITLGCVLSGGTFMAATGSAGTIEQSNDAPFHLLAIQRVATTGDGSWHNIRAVTGDTGFYPPLADDLAALVLRVVNQLHLPVDVVSASSVMLCVFVALVWPLGVDALVRAVLHHRTGGASLAGAASALLVPVTAAFPAQLLAFGALWPNLVGLALAPAVLAALVTALDGRERPGRGRGGWTPALTLVVVVLGSVGVALGHPSALLSLGVVASGIVLAAVARILRGRRVLGALGAVLGAVGLVGALLVVVRAATGVRAFTTTPTWSVPAAIGHVAWLQPVQAAAPTLAGLLALVGVIVCLARGSHRWLVVGWLLAGVQVVLAGSVTSGVTRLLTGLWYTEPARLSAALVLAVMPLAAIGALEVAERIDRLAHGSRPLGIAVLVGALVWAGVGLRDVHAIERDTYQGLGSDRTLVTPQELAFYARVLGTSGSGAVAGDPFGGAMFASLASGRPAVIGHFGQNLARGTSQHTKDVERVAHLLRTMTDDPSVCSAVRRLGIEYAVEDTNRIWTDDKRFSSFEGVRDLDHRAGFDLVARQGTVSVYRLTACTR